MSLKKEFVMLASKPEANKRELMRRYEISAPTGYKWLKRFECLGEEGLKERSRRPKRRAMNQTAQQIEERIIELKREYPYWGARKLRTLLSRLEGIEVPAISTVHNILKRNHLVGLDKGSPTGPYKRFNRSRPNELWQMDYKGHFGLSTGERCHPLTICDDHSRFNIVLAACSNEDTQTVKGHLRNAFDHYGLPDQILCDRGSPWGCGQKTMTHLAVWLIQVGVNLIHGRAYHPQTQGKQERFHRTLKHELLSRTTAWKDRQQCQKAFQQWRHQYNYLRPHESINDQVPIHAYHPSARSFPQPLTAPENYYLQEDHKRKVKSKGEITFKNQSFYIGKGFAGQWIALRKITAQIWEVFFCWKSLGFIDLSKVTKLKNQYEPLLSHPIHS